MMAFGFSIGHKSWLPVVTVNSNTRLSGPSFIRVSTFCFHRSGSIHFSLCFSPHILKKVISSEHIYDASISYINWRVFGFFFSFVGVMFRAFFVGTTQTKTLTLNSVVMVLSNVVFNYILIFGVRCSTVRYRRSRHRFVTGRNGFGHLLRHLHLETDRLVKSMPWIICPDSGRRWNGSWTYPFGQWFRTFSRCPLGSCSSYLSNT